ncbi:MAG: GPP34 family phosphoprotein, partial [Chloroflexota bacterium]|nr:GPP34 family phosphoprotein [Chloroflexota bacterium]
IRERTLPSLVEQGVLEARDVRILWLFRSRRSPARDQAAKNAVKLRIMEVLFSEEIPHPRDVVIICLADTCGIFKQLLSKRELGEAAARIDQVRQLDLIGQAVSGAMRDIEMSLAAALHPYV